jgi:hypothetical protein
MDKENMADYLKTIPKPVPASPAGQKILKVALFSARRSSRIGFLLVAFPGLVILLFLVQQLFHLSPGFTRWLDGGTTLSTPVRGVLVFIFVVGFPLIAIVLNLLSICYFQYDRIKKEFHISFRLRWWNIIITLAGGALASFYILHLLADTILQ